MYVTTRMEVESRCEEYLKEIKVNRWSGKLLYEYADDTIELWGNINTTVPYLLYHSYLSALPLSPICSTTPLFSFSLPFFISLTLSLSLSHFLFTFTLSFSLSLSLFLFSFTQELQADHGKQTVSMQSHIASIEVISNTSKK